MSESKLEISRYSYISNSVIGASRFDILDGITCYIKQYVKTNYENKKLIAREQNFIKNYV